MSVFCCTDLHGRYDLWENMNKYLFKANDRIFFLGDAIDRGPQGYKLMQELLNDSRVTYLIGNHEDMFIEGAWELIEHPNVVDLKTLPNFNLSVENGGLDTYTQWTKDGAPTKILDTLIKLPAFCIYTNVDGIKIHLSHAGCNPWMLPKDEDEYFWDRSHYLWKEWIPNKIADMVIHGHTPYPYLMGNDKEFCPQEDGLFWYCDERKVDLDCYSVGTGCAFVLDLNTMDEHIIDVD